MNHARRRWTRRLTALCVAVITALLLGGIFSTLTSDNPALARPGDAEAAARVLESPGADDFRLSLPPGEWISARGLIEPEGRPTELASAESGLLVEILVGEADRVETGQIVAKLDDALQRAALQAARATERAARVDVERALQGSLSLELDAVRAELDQVEADAERAAARAERLDALFDAGITSEDDVEAARLERAARQSEARAVAARLASLRAGRHEAIREAQARLDQAEARRLQAAAELARRAIRAPEAGEVLQIKYRIGEFLSPEGLDAEPLLILGETRTPRVRVDVDERDLASLRIGSETLVRTPAAPTTYIEGTVTEIGRRMGRKNVRTDDPVERNDSRILEVLVDLEPEETGQPLIIGQRVDVFIAKPR